MIHGITEVTCFPTLFIYLIATIKFFEIIQKVNNRHLVLCEFGIIILPYIHYPFSLLLSLDAFAVTKTFVYLISITGIFKKYFLKNIFLKHLRWFIKLFKFGWIIDAIFFPYSSPLFFHFKKYTRNLYIRNLYLYIMYYLYLFNFITCFMLSLYYLSQSLCS